jgi:serine/threonine protein kinase
MNSSSETHARPTSSHPIDPGGFAPGTILADRYRIVALAGRDGMGEVFRADDLKLGQAVALKFLPPALEHDTAAHEKGLLRRDLKPALVQGSQRRRPTPLPPYGSCCSLLSCQSPGTT